MINIIKKSQFHCKYGVCTIIDFLHKYKADGSDEVNYNTLLQVKPGPI